ncbi:UNVERIFIED_CONTAM: hypothetical protein Sradi_3641700 [Sesamum radiatum]|uniref:Uncharacterized protein n=1 Tax=Sesamum radiatum TaxID=300843 RepID=A0AAW2QIN0_SESRA
MQASRAKNLFYNCDEIFKPGHKCKQHLMYCIMTKDEAIDLEQGFGAVEGGDDDSNMMISLNEISGSTNLNTLRVKGRPCKRKIQMLIDSGSTNCFLDEESAQVLGCHLDNTTPMVVCVADGNKIVSRL